MEMNLNTKIAMRCSDDPHKVDISNHIIIIGKTTQIPLIKISLF